jgi:hypothetical protein
MIWPHVRSALEAEVLAGSKLRHVTVSGHSLGAAVATLVSYAAQRFLDAHNAGIAVGAILVAAPNGRQEGGGRRAPGPCSRRWGAALDQSRPALSPNPPQPMR